MLCAHTKDLTQTSNSPTFKPNTRVVAQHHAQYVQRMLSPGLSKWVDKEGDVRRLQPNVLGPVSCVETRLDLSRAVLSTYGGNPTARV